jgi:hypothetical protein
LIKLETPARKPTIGEKAVLLSSRPAFPVNLIASGLWPVQGFANHLKTSFFAWKAWGKFPELKNQKKCQKGEG